MLGQRLGAYGCDSIFMYDGKAPCSNDGIGLRPKKIGIENEREREMGILAYSSKKVIHCPHDVARSRRHMLPWHANNFYGGGAIARGAGLAATVNIDDHLVEEIEVLDGSEGFAVTLLSQVRLGMGSGNDG